MHSDQQPQSPQPNAALQAIVRGRVHGVGFRMFVLNRALRLGLGGWVRNAPGGTVEVYATGERSRLEELLSALREGPPAAYVRDVNYSWLDVSGAYTPPRFEVRH